MHSSPCHDLISSFPLSRDLSDPFPSGPTLISIVLVVFNMEWQALILIILPIISERRRLKRMDPVRSVTPPFLHIPHRPIHAACNNAQSAIGPESNIVNDIIIKMRRASSRISPKYLVSRPLFPTTRLAVCGGLGWRGDLTANDKSTHIKLKLTGYFLRSNGGHRTL